MINSWKFVKIKPYGVIFTDSSLWALSLNAMNCDLTKLNVDLSLKPHKDMGYKSTLGGWRFVPSW